MTTTESKTADSLKRRYYISPDNIAALKVRAPRTGHHGGGMPNIQIPLNSGLQRHFAFCAMGLRNVFTALPDERDRAFIRHVLMGIATDDVTLTENPIAYIQEIEEAATEYEQGEEPFTSALLPTLKRFGPLEALGLVDWVEQEKIKK